MESKTSSSFQGDCQAFRRFEWIYSGTPLNGRPSTADTIIVGRKLYGQVDQGVGQVDQGLGQVFHIVLVKLWRVLCLLVGDFGQLTPVMDLPLPRSVIADFGRTTCQLFSKAVVFLGQDG